jgi:DNA-binding CsgD family transcriptional regulator
MKPTPAEREALEAWARHETVKEAAHALGKSPRTVEQQLRSVRTRLGVSKTHRAYLLTRDDDPT